MNRFRRYGVIRMAVGIGLLAYLFASDAIDWSALVGILVAWELSLTALMLLFLVIVIVSWRLKILLSAQGLLLRLVSAIRLTLIGGFFNSFLPGSSGGDVVRMYLAARQHPGHRTEIATVVLVDRFLGALSLLALPIVVVMVVGPLGAEISSTLEGLIWVAVAGLGAAAVVLVAGSRTTVRRFLIRVLGLVRLDLQARRFFDTLAAYRWKQRAVLLTAFLSLVIQTIVVASLLLLVRATSETDLTWGLVLVIPFGMFANALPLTPGGLGVGEAAFAALFASVGARGGAEVLLAWRLLTTLFDLLGGGLFALGRTRFAMAAEHEAPVDAERAPAQRA